MRLPILVSLLAMSALLLGARADDAEQAASDQQVLRQANVELDDGALLEYFRKRTLLDADLPKIKELVRKLSDDVFVVRNRATNDLIAMGSTALPALREALVDGDSEVVRRAASCLEIIEKSLNPAASAAAGRLRARHQAVATKELLGFLPFAEDESVADAVRAALTTLAARDGKPDPVLLAGTTDTLTVRRAAAVEALLRGKAIAPEEGRKFL